MPESYQPQHLVPQGGLPAWSSPDGSVAAVASLDPGLDVEVKERLGAWARIACSNGWEAWVDGRLLVEMQPAPPAPPPPAPIPMPEPALTPEPAPTPEPEPELELTPEPTPAPAPAPTREPEPAAEPEPVPAPAASEPTAAPGAEAAAPSAAWTAPAPGAEAAAPSAAWTAPAPTAQSQSPVSDAPAPGWGAPAASAEPTAPISWGPPGAAPAGARRGIALGLPQILAMVGGALFLLSAWLRWLRFAGGGGSRSFTAYVIPAHFLLDSRSGFGGLNLGIVVFVIGAACIAAAVLGALSKRFRILSLIVGLAAVGVVVLFLVQANYLRDEFNSRVPRDLSYFDVVRFGARMAAVGSVLALVGGILGLTRKT